MIIKPHKLRNGDKGIIMGWVNQPTYRGNTIEKIDGELIMTDKNGFKTKLIDMEFSHFAKYDIC